ncbi:YybH family protein [Blastococcus sp. PRF04-17]|uniref:YybH family protein n=1 Tax=Blastococcus sp. PRF04-17 TaxID=2933797 RepID=UPI001FF5C5B3|nr:SgcJ/EcaC family oxidoreductase [Blastococcus sp. PRF04-17]UOY03034.1 SgcJ/EcaC family oxidoreductase [Blastococcus sp. PRF04-17]
MAGVELRDMHRTFESAFNDHDLDRAMQLYAPDTTMLLQDGTELHGAEAIRSSLEAMFGVPGRMTMRTRYVVESGDLAVLSSEWTLVVGDETQSATTAEVARREADGGWRYAIDDPYASLHAADSANVVAQLEDANLGVIRNVARR